MALGSTFFRFRSNPTTPQCPPRTAHNSGVSPVLVFTSGLTSCRQSSSRTTCSYPCCTAIISGVRPSSLAFGLILRSSSNPTTPQCPLSAAHHRAVRPSHLKSGLTSCRSSSSRTSASSPRIAATIRLFCCIGISLSSSRSPLDSAPPVKYAESSIEAWEGVYAIRIFEGAGTRSFRFSDNNFYLESMNEAKNLKWQSWELYNKAGEPCRECVTNHVIYWYSQGVGGLNPVIMSQKVIGRLLLVRWEPLILPKKYRCFQTTLIYHHTSSIGQESSSPPPNSVYYDTIGSARTSIRNRDDTLTKNITSTLCPNIPIQYGRFPWLFNIMRRNRDNRRRNAA
jgi:hypothetical protein